MITFYVFDYEVIIVIIMRSMQTELWKKYSQCLSVENANIVKVQIWTSGKE